MACVIVFATTYSLILPAITMELEKASEMDGVFLEDTPEDPAAWDEDPPEIVLYNGSSDSVSDQNSGDADLSEDPTAIFLSDGSDEDNSVVSGGFSDGFASGFSDEVSGETGVHFSDETADGSAVYLSDGTTGVSAIDLSDGAADGSSVHLSDGAADGFTIRYSDGDADAFTDSDSAGVLLEDAEETVYPISALDAQNLDVGLHLDFQDTVPGDTNLIFRPIDSEYFDNYYTGAKTEISRAYSGWSVSDYTAQGGLFWNVTLGTGAAGAVGTLVTLTFDLPLENSIVTYGQNLVRTGSILDGADELAVVDWSDGRWHVYDAVDVVVERRTDGSVSQIWFETDALRTGSADFGVLSLSRTMDDNETSFSGADGFSVLNDDNIDDVFDSMEGFIVGDEASESAEGYIPVDEGSDRVEGYILDSEGSDHVEGYIPDDEDFDRVEGYIPDGDGSDRVEGFILNDDSSEVTEGDSLDDRDLEASEGNALDCESSDRVEGFILDGDSAEDSEDSIRGDETSENAEENIFDDIHNDRQIHGILNEEAVEGQTEADQDENSGLREDETQSTDDMDPVSVKGFILDEVNPVFETETIEDYILDEVDPETETVGDAFEAETETIAEPAKEETGAFETAVEKTAEETKADGEEADALETDEEKVNASETAEENVNTIETAEADVNAIETAEEEATEAVPMEETEAAEATVNDRESAAEAIETAEEEMTEAIEEAVAGSAEAIGTAEEEKNEALESVEEEATEALETAEEAATEAIETAEEEATEAIETAEEDATEAIEEIYEEETEEANESIYWELDPSEEYISDQEYETEAETESPEEAPEELEALEEAETETETLVRYPEQSFSYEGEVSVYVTAPEGAFPENTSMVVTPVDDDENMEAIAGAVTDENTNTTVQQIQAVDITFFNEEGNEIEPLIPIRVRMVTKQSDAQEDTVVVHVDDAGMAETVDNAAVYKSGDETHVMFKSGEVSEFEENSSEAEMETAADLSEYGDTDTWTDIAENDIATADFAPVSDSAAVEFAEEVGTLEVGQQSAEFETDQFSIYAVVYTVDFHYEVNGKTYEFSIPGGGFASFSKLVEVLGVAKNGTQADSSDVSVEATEDETEREHALTLDDVEVSDKTRSFVSDVEKVEFSSPELVWVGKVERESIVGALKEANELEVEYSAELTEEQIAEINAQTVEAGDWALISMQPFTSEETLTVTMKNGEQFLVSVTDAQIKKTVIDARGDTWEITVTYDEKAQIPDGAELNVREILPTDEEYEALYNSAAAEACSDAEKQGIGMPVPSGARLFDIEILGEDGKIEPSAPVQVSIRLVGAADADYTSVVHFGVDGAKALTAQTSEIPAPEMQQPDTEAPEEKMPETRKAAKDTASESVAKEVIFQADSFSVYTVVNVTDFGSIAVSDKKYALVTGIANDPGATTGYSETWGRDYFTIIVNAHAMSDQHFLDGQNRVDGFQVQPVHAYEDGGVSYVGGSPAQWQFESAGNGKYYLSVNGKYLQRFNKGNNNDHQWGWEARLVDNRNDATQLSIDVNSDGTILIHDGGLYLHNEGNGEWATREFKFTNQNVNTNSAAYRFRVCEESELFDSFAARKVSVQDLTVNNRFLIYRKFEDSQGNEQLYALASDGTFVRVYDGGDTVYWRETDKNLYWNYRMEGGYYSIYSTNPATGETVYINPMHSEPSQTISTEPSRLTLIGKDNGEYGTALENWDQTAYDYAGLHVTLNDQGVPVLSTGTRVAGTSDEFLFAVASTMPADAAERVKTVDSEALGIHITVFDYGRDDFEYNAGDKLDSMADVVASNRDVANNYQPHQANALVKPYLEDDLPSSKTKGAMAGLFTPGGSAVTYSQSGVTNLFLKSYYDESGMFRYRSEDNFAYLGKNGNTSFTVYRQAATPYPYDTAPGHTYYTHGHYMPFNDIDMTTNVSRLMNQYGNDYQNGQAVGELPVGDGRTYEDIYGTQGIPNFFTGMKMEADFTQLKDGRLENGDPMVFKFTGDDDMWVYIDGVLVLDIGGIHEPLSGTIDFSTGKVNNPTGSSLAGEKTLYQIFMAVLNNNSTPQDVKDRINAITWKDVNGDGIPDTFADYTNHDFKAFYMERGAGASNLDIQFNLKVVRPGEVVVEKQVPEGVDPRFVNQEYKFQATFKDYTNNDEIKPLYVDARYGTEQENIACTAVFYKDRKDDEGNPVPVTVDENGCFTLKAGEAAVFMIADKKIEYTIKEVEINSEQTRQVEINGQVVTVSESTAEAAYARVQDRSQLKYKNHPYLQNLNITKHLLPEGTQAGSGDVFEFRVYLESTVEVEGETVRQLTPYSYGPYYVTKEVNGVTHYYTLTGANNAPEDKGTTPVVCSTTGRSGSINSIPPEYTVVIPNLAVGTHFYVEERRDNIPAGFVFDHEELVEETYDTQTLGSDDDIISRILARDEQDRQAFDHATVGRIKKGVDAKSEVYNKKVCVNVQKQWLKMNGQPYTLEEARRLPGSTDAVITAELWKKQTAQETGGETEAPVTVTFMVNTTEDSEYRRVSVPVTIKKDSTLEFSLGARGTSQAQEIHTDPEYSVSRSSVSSNPKITYSNGRQKDKWSKYTISGIAENTTVYATFDAAKVSDDFVGLYIASMEEPGASATPVEEKVADITLNNGNDWMQQIPMEQGYTYFLMNVVETGLESYTHQYSFISAPAVTTDQDGNLILAVANKYREPINITVEKVWSPALSGDEENSAYVTVELHRYAKKTKGVFEVVLKDNYGAPIEGAVFKLYKDGVAQEQDYTTDVNGRIAANNLEPGTYYFKQISTSEGYSMSDSAPQTEEFAVEDNQTVPQEMHCELQNQALETNGVATLTLLDNNGDPIQGAKYNLIKREGSQEVVIREGLLTDANGQITVSQLRVGTYYFFETEPPAAYKLPDYWQDTDFTVLEHPGTVQYFNLSMTNDLKGKGYVEVTLTGPGGQAVSGAMFELYQGSEKQAEGSTGPDGKLTFGDPERLAAGTYTVKQVTSDAELLPAGAPQEFTILENGDPDQKKELSFTNPYRGKGTATVTLTRKDSGEPISGATFELYKDGSLFDTKTTDSDGQLTFGDPDKLLAGNYSIRQVTTVEGLEPVITSDSFAILENGNPNQTHSWTVQNEDNAGNVTIKLWRKGGFGQWNWDNVATYNNLKTGRTYSFTARLSSGLYPNVWYYQDESDHNNYDSISQNQASSLNSSGWDSSTNSYHFTITPTKDNTTYSYVLISGWGTTNIETMSMDEGSRQASAPASDRYASQQVAQAITPKALSLNSAKAPAQVLQNNAASVDRNNAPVTRDVPAPVSPSGPPSDDYIVDSTFTETYKIRKSDNWQHVFENLDKYDLDENPYYYYVVETECMPDTYHLVSYGNDNLTETGTITITNTLKLGSVKVTKAFSGIDSLPNAFKITASYTVDSTSHSVDLTTSTTGMTGSGTSADPYTWTISDLPLDTVVTFTESGYEKTGYTVTTSPEGVNDVVSTTATVVLEPTTANGGVASFTNTYTQKTVNIPVNKTWAFATDSGITKVEEKDWPQGVTVHVVLYSKTGDNAPSATTNTVDLTADKSSDTFTGLPEYDGENKIDYSVVEAGVTGIDGNAFNTVVEGNATDGYTIRNTEKEAGLTIIKAFEGAPLTDAEKNAITFTVTGSGLKDRNKNGNSVTSLTRTYAEFTNGQWVLNQRDGIVANGTYTVTETSANVQKYTRVSTVKVNDGDATIFTQDGTNTDAAGNTPTGQITMSGTTGTVIITNTYTKEKTEVSGSKTWVDEREHNNAAEITLKLYRKVKGADDSTYAEVQSDEYNFTWDGNTYTFSDLDKNVSNDDDPMTTDDEKEYVYKVEEVSVNVTEAGTTDSGTTVSYKKEADGTNFTNTELTDIEATKTWKQGNDSVNATITNASITFELQRKSGENWSKVEQDELTNPVTITVEDTPSETAWKATWNQLPKYEIVDEGTSQTVAKIEYRVVETAATVLTDDVKPETDPTVEVSDGTVNIDNTLPDTGISVTKQWKDGSESHVDKEFAEDRTITFTLYQKLGDAAGTVYTPYGNNGKGTVTYTAATKIWGTTEITGLPKYVLDTATNTWTKASYYVVEDSISGVAITYKKGDGEAAEAAESSVVTADDTARNITIVNEDMVTSIKVVKVDQNNQTTKLDGAKFELYKKQTNGTQYVKYLKAAFPESPYETSSELTITDKDAGITFTGLTEGEYQLKETKSPDGYVLTGNAVINFKVTNGVISNEAGEQSFIVQFDVAADATPATYTIGNTPGAALPNTGGPGTNLIYLLGLMLTGVGCGGLMMRKRRKKQHKK